MTGILIEQCDPVLDEFFAHTSIPTQGQLNYLTKRHGVPPRALGGDADGNGLIIGAAGVVFDGAATFDFAEKENRSEAAAALIFLARDRDGSPLDLVAWTPRTDRVASRFGRAAVLGENSLYGSRFAGPPPVHRRILAWLQAGRDGVVVVNPARAARSLLDSPGRLIAEDAAHAADLARLLSSIVDLSRIVLPAKRVAAA